MKAVLYDEFRGPLRIADIPSPDPDEDGVVIRLGASGICRSDWHGWQGHDADIRSMPHVPGHELAGTIEETGKNVSRWKPGARVTIPFVAGCGTCPECASGNHQICDNQYQPGFSGWGSFAEYVSIRFADANLVGLPDEVDYVTAASLGCRFATSYRAVVAQGAVEAGQWVAVHGCGGVGLSAVMIAHALGARVVGVDIDPGALSLARTVGAELTINAAETEDVAAAIHEVTGRGAHVSVDALGSSLTCANSISCLRKRGRHVQVGLLAGADYRPPVPMEQVISRELELYGSHGMQAAKYDEMLALVVSGKLDPRKIVGRTVALDEAPAILENMGRYGATGIAVIDTF
jgi:alcohol dehydrogenase